MRNLRFAVRTLAKSPMVSLVAILSLALGIGANTAIFSLFEQVVLRQLAVVSPQELVLLTANGPRSGSNSTNNAGGNDSIFSYAMFRDLEQKQTVFTGLAAHRSFGANLSYQGQTSSSSGIFVSGSYFPVLGLKPAAGRLLGPDDDRIPGGHPVVVLSHPYWKEKFNLSADVIGKSMIVNGVAMTVVGVAPEGFRGITLGSSGQVFVPISMREALTPGWKGLAERRSYWAYLFARLNPGVTPQRAESEMNGIYLNVIRNVELPLQKGMSEKTKSRFVSQRMKLMPGDSGQSSLLGAARTPLVLLLAIAGFVLLIACANIANLLLARSANRAKEFSIRLSLGASRGQVMAQVLTESLVMSLLAGVAGIFVAYATTAGMVALLPRGSEEIFDSRITASTVWFALVLSVVAGFVFGLFPAVHSTRMDLAGAMKDQAGNLSSTGAARQFRRVLVTAQIALSLVLLVSAGMFLKSLVNVLNVNLGLRTENVISFGLSPELNQYTPERTRAFFEQLESRVAAIPGVDGVSVSMVPLVSGNNWGSNVGVDGFQAGPDTDTHSMYNEVGPGFFKLMRISMMAGREFQLSDSAAGPKVAIVNEAFVRKFGNGQGLLGKRMQVGSGGKNDIEIVGVVRDVKYSEVKDATPPTFYLPYRQDPKLGGAEVYVGSATGVTAVLPEVRRVVAELDPNLPMENVRSMEAQVKENIVMDRFVSTLAAAFAALATLLAAVGLYGVLSYTVARRTREIGIRLAIGADAPDIRNMVMREVSWMVLIGVALGLPSAYGLMRFAESLLYEIKSGDVVVMASAVLMIALVSLGAGYGPARRAMGVEPLEALRYE